MRNFYTEFYSSKNEGYDIANKKKNSRSKQNEDGIRDDSQNFIYTINSFTSFYPMTSFVVVEINRFVSCFLMFVLCRKKYERAQIAYD